MHENESRNPIQDLHRPDLLGHRCVLRADHASGDIMSGYEVLGLFGAGCLVAAIFILIALEFSDD